MLRFLRSSSGALSQIMRAIRVKEFGGADQLLLEKDVPIPQIGENDVLIKVKAAGVNPVDTYIRSGNYSALPSLPYTPGQDVGGVVEDVGSKVTDFKKGDRVITVRTISGAYAQYTAANSLYVTHLNPNLSFAQGSAIGVPYFTAIRALDIRAQAKPNETVLIHGASGAVGIASTQIAKAKGLTVLGTAGSEEGLQMVKSNGADFAFNHRDANYQQLIMNATDGKGVDIILEMLANVNLENDLKMVRYHGKVVVIGCRGSIEINPRLTMAKESTIMGVALLTSSEDEWKAMRKAVEEGQNQGYIKPLVSRTYSLENAQQAHIDVINNEGSTGKLVIEL